MSDFDWQTDESNWDDAPDEPLETGQSYPQQRLYRLVALAAIATIVTLGGWQLSRQARERVTSATAQVEQDVRASFELVYESAGAGDRELFSYVLSGSEREWTTAQQLLLGNGNLFGREALGLTWLDEPAELIGMEISPNLYATEITATIPYAVDIGNSLTRTVKLQHHGHYRRGETRWLFAPPPLDFWGDIDNIRRGRQFTVRYPDRDAAFAASLTTYLDEQMQALCLRLDRDIPELAQACRNLYINVTLSTDPMTLVDLTTLNLPRGRPQQLGALTLPTPTLLGSPTDNHSRQALQRGYARQLFYPVLANLTGYTCCDQSAVFQAAADRILADLGIVAWPLTAENFLALAESDARMLSSAHPVWSDIKPDELDVTERTLAYGLVEFMQQSFSAGPAAMITALAEDNGGLYDWMLAFESSIMDEPLIVMIDRWERFVERLAYAERSAPLPLPDETLYAACNRFGERRGELRRFDFNRRQWETVYTTSSLLSLAPMPDGSSLWLQHQSRNAERTSAYLWRSGEWQTILPESSRLSLWYWGESDPSGERLTVFASGSNGGDAAFPFASLDWRACLDSGCEPEWLRGVPIWSPGGDHMLLYRPGLPAPGQKVDLVLADAKGEEIRTVLTDYRLTEDVQDAPTYPSITWLDAERFLVLATSGEADASAREQTLWLGDVNSAELTPYIDLAAITEQLGAKLPKASLRYTGAFFDKQAPQTIYMTLVRSERPAASDELMTWIIQIDLANGLAEIVSTYPRRLASTLYFLNFSTSPDGRFQTLATIDGADLIVVFSFADNRLQAIGDPGFSSGNDFWSLDGNWTAVPAGEYVQLAAPEFDYAMRLYVDDGYACSGAAWVAEAAQ